MDTKDTSARAGHDVDWAGLRAYLPDTTNYGNVTLLAVKAQATNNLSGQSARQINVVATRKIKTVTATGLSSTTSATRSVAAALADMATNTVYGGGLAASAIDWSALYALDQALTARGDYLDVRFDSASTLWEALSQAGVVARTKPFMQGGVMHFARDQSTSVPVALFSMRNIVQNSLSINYLTPTSQTADSVQVTYFDNTVWQQTTVSCVLSGGTSNNPAKVSMLGITSRDQAYREGLYQAAANKYRRKVIKFSTECDGFIPAFGDLIAIQHDIPAWGQHGEVTGYALANNLLTYSEQFDNAATWFPANGTISPNTVIAPDGQLTADKLTASGAGVLIFQNVTVTAGTTYTATIYIKASGSAIGKPAQWWAWFSSTATGTNTFAYFNLSSTWTRVSVTFTPTGTGVMEIRMDAPYPSVAGDEVHIWGAQLEAASTAGPYIATTTAARTNIPVVTVNEQLTWTAGQTHYVGLRKRDGSIAGPYVATQGAAANILVLGTTPSFTPYTGADEERTHIAFGPGETWRQPARVVAVQPRGLYQVEITAVNEDGSVHTADTGMTAPALVYSQLPATAALPAITGLSLVIDVTGAAPQYVASWAAAPGADHYVAEISFDGGVNWAPLATVFGTAYRWAANHNASAAVRVAAVNIGRGAWATVSVSYASAPSTPTGMTAAADYNKLKISWTPNPELDVVGYEIRTTDTGWGSTGSAFSGSALSALVTAPTPSTSLTYYLRAFDFLGNYSATSATLTFTAPAVVNISAFTASFYDTSATSAAVTLTWTDVAPQFGLNGYQVSYGSTTLTTSSNTITLPANWVGDRTITVKTVDRLGNLSTGYAQTVTKLAPASPTGFRVQVIDNTVMLYWNQPSVTTLPISHYTLRRGSTWAAADIDYGRKDGLFTTIAETAGGTYTYWIATVDTDDNLSTPVSVTAIVAQPPDFVLYGQFASAFAGTKSSAVLEAGAVVLPVNTTETWDQHFTSHTWTSPQDQITAGYPVFIQPSNSPGYYEETFDFGTVLASSRVSIAYNTTTVAGTPLIVPTLSTSANGTTWLDNAGQTQVFATNFRYVKVRITVTDSAGTGIATLNSLAVTLDAKLKTDAGTTSCVSTDASGTVANFNSVFVDVASITVTPQSTTPVTAVYDFLDSVVTGTYSITSNVCTVNATAHSLVVGQNVRLSFTSGTAPSGVYTVASVVNANQYTVALTTANTSGNVSTYPQGMRIYLFNSAGTRVSGTASWSIRGT
jgi:Putative phage tail protein